MDSKLKERFARLGPIRAIDRVSSGSAVVFALLLDEGAALRTVDAMYALARRGLTMLGAKRTIEALVADGRVLVGLPTVESSTALENDFAQAGVLAVHVNVSRGMGVGSHVVGQAYESSADKRKLVR